MNHLKNQNKFEDKLKKQLDGIDAKPSDDLWEKIEQGLPEDAFEIKVAGKLDTLKITPDPEIWPAIESRLPVEVSFYKRRVVLVLAGLVFLMGLVGRYNLQNDIFHANNTETTVTVSQNKPEKKFQSSKSKKELSYSTPKVQNTIRANTTDENEKGSIPFVNYRDAKQAKSLASTFVAKSQRPKVDNTSTKEVSEVAPTLLPDKSDILSNDQNGNNNIENLNVTQNQPLVVNTKIDPSLKQTEVSAIANKPVSLDSAINSINPLVLTNPQAVVNAENYSMPDEMPLSNYSITAFTGYNMCYNHLVSPNTVGKDFSKNIALRNSVESPTAEWTGAFLANLHLNAKWYLSSGIILTNFRQDLTFGVKKPINELYGGEENASYVHNADSITNGGGQKGIISYSFTEIPLFVSYRFAQKHKFEFEVQGGFSWGILSGANAQMVDQYNVGLLQINSKTDFPPLRNVFFFTLQPMASYKLNSSVNIGVMTSLKTSINSMVATPYWVQQYPYFVGLNVFIRKRF